MELTSYALSAVQLVPENAQQLQSCCLQLQSECAAQPSVPQPGSWAGGSTWFALPPAEQCSKHCPAAAQVLAALLQMPGPPHETLSPTCPTCPARRKSAAGARRRGRRAPGSCRRRDRTWLGPAPCAQRHRALRAGPAIPPAPRPGPARHPTPAATGAERAQTAPPSPAHLYKAASTSWAAAPATTSPLFAPCGGRPGTCSTYRQSSGYSERSIRVATASPRPPGLEGSFLEARNCAFPTSSRAGPTTRLPETLSLKTSQDFLFRDKS